MVDRISTSGALLNSLTLLQRNTVNLDQLQFRVATGRKFAELKLYGNDAPRIVDLKAEISSRQAYIRSITLAEGITRSYDAVLDRLADVAGEIIDASEPISPDDPSFLTDTTVVANNLMLEIEANLNVRIGDRFIFAGTRFDTAPVQDIRDLALYNEDDFPIVANTIETANEIPEFTVQRTNGPITQSYHTSFAGADTIDAEAWRKTTLTISDQQRLEYGITATDSAFQNLVEAAMRLKSATDRNANLTVDQRETLLGNARSAAEQARVELRQLQSTNGAVINQFDRMVTQHENFISISQSALDEIEGADTAQAAVEISALQTQIQASFTTIARRAQLSLVSFLN
ncbi:MAG: flagellin [Marivibrio sp.]|uniref:flagellin n=1 Tax=Marivibrio sp. TaxID=2039719 RepID=UPI0032EC33B0